MCPQGSHPRVPAAQGWPWGAGQGSPMRGVPVGCPQTLRGGLTPLGRGNPCPAWAVAPHAAPPPGIFFPFLALSVASAAAAGLGEEASGGTGGSRMGSEGPDLYENLQIRYPRALDLGTRPPPSRRVLGTLLAVGLVTLLALGAALVAMATLRAWDRAELRVARAELEVLGPLPSPEGTRSPGDSPEVAQRRREALGRWLQGLGLGWRYHRGRIYYFSWGKKPWREAREFCLSRQAQLTSITSWDEQEFLARESRGGSYWIGLEDGGPNDTWRWVDGTAYSPANSFWAPGQPDRQQHGQQGREGCAQIHPVGTGLWNDHNCNIPFLWICKRGLGGP
uniref:C-type lectin domain-containing protein n=1 Tax=Anas zonorhyncha TaxID=75864 RepID=A0A8B9VW29_9AVES